MKKMPDPQAMKRIKGPKLSRHALATAKVRVTTYLDKSVLDTLRQLSKASGAKYQTMLNQILRDYFFGQNTGLVARIARLEAAVFEG